MDLFPSRKAWEPQRYWPGALAQDKPPCAAGRSKGMDPDTRASSTARSSLGLVSTRTKRSLTNYRRVGNERKGGGAF